MTYAHPDIALSSKIPGASDGLNYAQLNGSRFAEGTQHDDDDLAHDHRQSGAQTIVQQPGLSRDMKAQSLNGLERTRNEDGERTWSYGLFSCQDTHGVVKAALCPCVVYARTAARLNHIDQYDMPNPRPHVHPVRCVAHCIADLACLGWTMSMFLRGRVRERYSIRGSCPSDCIQSLVYPCSLHQEERELDLEERTLWQLGVQPDDLAAFERGPGGMRRKLMSWNSNECGCFPYCDACLC